MSASTTETLNVKNFLQQQFIVTSSEWIEACIAFVKQENNQTLSLQNLQNFVYQQWLNADLEEIGVPSLPVELPTAQKITLNGSFVVQVDGIRDVGRPAYSQLKDMESNKSSNADFSAAPESALPPWEAKPTRMLMLNLTDGCSHVQGMEYKPLTFISPNLSPGVKVLLQGPIDCRFGVLLLTAEKIKVLGGEVETKLTQFSRRTILREILQLPPENQDDVIPTNIDSQAENAETISTINNLNPSAFAPSQSPGQQNNVQRLNISRQNTSNRNSGDRHMNQSSRTDTTQQNFNNHSSAAALPRGQQSAFSDGNQYGGNMDVDDFENEDDDFEQSLDYGVLDELEKESLNKSGSTDTQNEVRDVWLEADEDVVRDMWALQDETPDFEMPPDHFPTDSSSVISTSGLQKDKPFTYLSSVLNNSSADCIITIKGFIISVLSKLECTLDRGWSLMVRINDGTACLDANIHDEVLEGIIGVSAPNMVKMQRQAAENPEKRREVMEAISKCKVTLQDYSCLMDVKFMPDSKPSIVKCYPVDQLHAQQLLERVRCNS